MRNTISFSGDLLKAFTAARKCQGKPKEKGTYLCTNNENNQQKRHCYSIPCTTYIVYAGKAVLPGSMEHGYVGWSHKNAGELYGRTTSDTW